MRATALAVLAALLAAPLAVGSALAGPVADAARDAERLAGEGKPAEAAAALERARAALWRDLPLTVLKAQFVTAAPQGYGVYEPRRTATFKPGDTLYVYGEVVGYGYGRAGDLNRIDFDVALSVTRADGSVAIAPQSGRLTQTSRAENRDYILALVYEPKGLAAGDYVLQAALKDANSAKTTTMKLPFQIR